MMNAQCGLLFWCVVCFGCCFGAVLVVFWMWAFCFECGFVCWECSLFAWEGFLFFAGGIFCL